MTDTKSAAWWMAIRPKTLPAALAPVLVGSAVAGANGHFAPTPAIAAALGALLLQIGSNLANDYFDYFKGADTPDRLGPTRATASGLIAPREMWWGMVTVFAMAAAIGLYLIAIGGWPILAVGSAAIAAAVAYTGGPLPFGYHGMGDFFVFIFFGLVAVGGTYYVQALELPVAVVWAAVAPGTLITAILVVNNIRDLATDRRAGKRTLAVLIGRQGAQLEYSALFVAAYIAPVAYGLVAEWSWWLLLPWLTAPLAWRLNGAVWTLAPSAALNAVLAGTARLSLLHSVLFGIGIVVGSL
jgi:1,4-dihydroxy-2-naphthoate polyprenyltransferase